MCKRWEMDSWLTCIPVLPHQIMLWHANDHEGQTFVFMQILEYWIKCSIKNIYANFRSTRILFCVKTCTYIMMETNFIHKDVMKIIDYYAWINCKWFLSWMEIATDILKVSHKETEHIKTNYGRSMWNCIIRQLYYIVWNMHTMLKCVTPHIVFINRQRW